MKQQFLEYLNNAEFAKAETLLGKSIQPKIKDILLTYSCESESIIGFGFALYMFDKTNDYFWCDCIISLLLNPLCFIEGAYQLAYHYAKLMLSHNRSEENLVQILFFNEIPEKLLAKANAIKIAEEVISLNPNNETARNALNKLKQST